MQLEEGFLDFFNSLDDPRAGRNRLYTMSEILLCTLSAAICGAAGWQKEKYLLKRAFIPFAHEFSGF